MTAVKRRILLLVVIVVLFVLGFLAYRGSRSLDNGHKTARHVRLDR